MSLLLDELTAQFSRLPGIGHRTAMRLALHVLKLEPAEVDQMASALTRFRSGIKRCKICRNLSDADVCPICLSTDRDQRTICVVEQITDVMSIENTHQYRGVYHVLGGVISPMQGIAPSDLSIDELLSRLDEAQEVILAIPASVEGETTLFYLRSRLRAFPHLKITSIARGVGFGDELEYVDPLTLTHALTHRREIEE